MCTGSGLAEAVLGLHGLRVLDIAESATGELTVTVETTVEAVRCPLCGARAQAPDRMPVTWDATPAVSFTFACRSCGFDRSERSQPTASRTSRRVARRAVVGRPVETRVATRSGRASVPVDVEVVAADISDPQQAIRACAGIVYICVGLSYEGWPEQWPPMMAGMLDGAAEAGARFVFKDNCQMYGPVTVPMTEDLPLTNYGNKPATRSKITRMWQEAYEAGWVEVASVRASDFYGPGVTQAAFGGQWLGRLARGKSAQVVGDPDQPHSFAYVPDIARALISVGNADDAMGRAWERTERARQDRAPGTADLR